MQQQQQVQVERYGPGETGAVEVLSASKDKALIEQAEAALTVARSDRDAAASRLELLKKTHRGINARIGTLHKEAEALAEEYWQEMLKHFSSTDSELRSKAAVRLRGVMLEEAELISAVDRLVRSEIPVAELALMEAEGRVLRSEGEWYSTHSRVVENLTVAGLSAIGVGLGEIVLVNADFQILEKQAVRCYDRARALEAQVAHARERLAQRNQKK